MTPDYEKSNNNSGVSSGPQLLTVEQKAAHLFELVRETMSGATEALLNGDRETAKNLLAREEVVDSLYFEIETLVHERIAKLDLPRERLHELIVLLRMVPELERSGDLAEHIAWRASRGLGQELWPSIRGIIARMGDLGVRMWQEAASAFVMRDEDLIRELSELDEEMDELHVSMMAEIVSGSPSTSVAIELALIGRFYERLGDHAVNLAKRVLEYTLGWPDQPTRAR